MVREILASVEVDFFDVWDDLTVEEQRDIVFDNIFLIPTEELIKELEKRGIKIEQ